MPVSYLPGKKAAKKGEAGSDEDHAFDETDCVGFVQKE
jgi:hypothetical protein